MNDRQKFYAGLGVCAVIYELIELYNSIDSRLYDLNARFNNLRSEVSTNTSDIFDLQEEVNE
jgi:cell division protein FtsL